MPAQRLPWFRFWVGATAHTKARQLTDAQFRTWIELLDLAAQQPVRGRFESRKAAAAVSRRPAQHIATLVAARLIDETPEGLVMHDWNDWQRWRDGPANDTGTPPERLTNDSSTTTESPPESPGNDHVNDSRTTTEQHTNVSVPLREKKEERREIRDIRDEKIEAAGRPPGRPPGGVWGTNLPAEVVDRLRMAPIEAGGRSA